MASIVLLSGRSGVMIGKLQELAASPSASIAARVLSLAALGLYLDPESVRPYSHYVETGPGDACSIAGGHEGVPPSGSLPADYKHQIKATAASLERSTATPLPVRSAANCVLNLWRADAHLPTQLLSVEPSQLALSYLCANRFAIRNHNTVDVTVEYEIAGGSGKPSVQVIGKPDGATYAETIILAGTTSTVHLLFDGEILHTVVGSNTSCG
jgi:hypothetical protein